MKTKIKSHYNYFGWINLIFNFLVSYASLFVVIQIIGDNLSLPSTSLGIETQMKVFSELNKFSGRFTIIYLIGIIIITYIGLTHTNFNKLSDKVLYEYELTSKKLKNYSEKIIFNKEIVNYSINYILSIFYIIFCIIPFIILKFFEDVIYNIKNIKWTINFIPWMALTITILAIVFLVYYIKRSVNNK